MTHSSVRINYFGAFRKYGDHEILDLPADCSVADLKAMLIMRMEERIPDFTGVQLVRDSAIACNDTIVGPNHKVQPNDTVSILPPVCGG